MTGAAGADKTYKLGTGDPTKIKLIRLGRKQDALTWKGESSIPSRRHVFPLYTSTNWPLSSERFSASTSSTEKADDSGVATAGSSFFSMQSTK